MRKIFALVFSLNLWCAATSAQALTRGTYCSATTTDGVWAFSWSFADVFYNCNAVGNALAVSSSAPILRWTRGYYWGDAVNAVGLSCWGGTTWYRGVGAYPLQAAYNYASYYNGRGCTFVVN